MQVRFKDLQDPLVSLDLQEFQEALQIQDPQDLQEHSLDPRVQQVLQEVLQIQDPLVSLESLDEQELQELQDPLDPLDEQDPLDLLD
jgi:hypothetical protein